MRRIASLCLLFSLLALLFSSCGDEGVDETVFAMDTAVIFKLSGEKASSAFSAAKEELFRLETLLDAEGETLQALADGESVQNAELAALLSRASELGDKTGGALDVTLYPAVKLWGFVDQKYRVPSEDELEALKPHIDYHGISIKNNEISLPEGFEITLGAVAKGYAGDRLAEICRESGVESGILSLGGNVRLIGDKSGTPFKVAIRSPEGGNALMLALSDTNIITSGGYERYFEENGEIYHHILDPRTLAPARNELTSVTVISRDGTMADALSTALFVMGMDKAMEYYRKYGAEDGFEVVLLTDSGEAFLSEGLRGSFLSASEEYQVTYFGR